MTHASFIYFTILLFYLLILHQRPQCSLRGSVENIYIIYYLRSQRPLVEADQVFGSQIQLRLPRHIVVDIMFSP